MLKRIGAEESGEFKAIASGTLPSGKPVIVNADGTVSVISETSISEAVGSEVVFESATVSNPSVAYDSSNNKIVIAYRDNGNSGYGTAVVGTVSGNSISFGTPVVFAAASTSQTAVTYDVNSGKVVIAYIDGGNSSYGTAIVGTVSGTSISFGSEVVFESAAVDQLYKIVYDSNAQKVIIPYADQGNSFYGTAIVGTVSGTSISFGSASVFNTGTTLYIQAAYDSDQQKVVIAYTDNSNSNYGTAVVGTVSGTSISFGSESVFESAAALFPSLAYDTNAQKIVIAYEDDANSDHGTAVVGTVSGTSITFGTPVVFEDSSISDSSTVYYADAQKIVIAYKNNGNSNYGTFVVGTVSGTSISFSTPIVFNTGNSTTPSATYDSSNKKVVVAYRDSSNSSYGTSVVYQPAYTSTPLTSENYIGMSKGVVDGSVEAIGTPTVISTVQSSYFGSTYDTNSNKVVVTYWDQTNSKGMAVVGTVSGTSISFGTPVQYSAQSAFTYPQGVVFDSNSNKVVISYVDSGGSSYGTAIVGTVSGTSISFGTAVVFESASTAFPQATFDNVNNKVVIVYEDGGDSDKGKAVVGTVSGTSISFGSTATWNAGLTSYPTVAYDTNAQKVVVAYRDRSGSDHGKAVVGTVSGTSISFGSATTFNAANTNYNIVVYDEGAQKVVVYYQGASSMEAIVGTVSGTSISFGTATEFSASASTNMSATYAANAAKTVVFYRSAINSSYGTYNVGTISGTSITFSDPAVFEEADSRFTTATYDSDNEKVIVSYEDVGNSQYATSVVIHIENITRGEVADGGNASVDIIGSVSTNQNSLTAGQQYYVQTDGTISTTAGSPSVLAGTAISATELLVKT